MQNLYSIIIIKNCNFVNGGRIFMKKTAIIYGEARSKIQKRAIEELTKILLDYTTEYPVCVKYGEDIDTDVFRCIYIGTRENNPYIKKTSNGDLTIPESYTVAVKDNTVTVEGFDDAGVLYGVIDFYNCYIVNYETEKAVRNSNQHWNNIFERDSLPEFRRTSAPAVKERGLWTWGHVIYDYRDYLRNMMKLKMNGVIIWNDFVPANANEIVKYAHSCNIKVYWGFDWLWDTKNKTFFINDLKEESEKIFKKYEKEYADSDGDGIYFQTFTETQNDSMDGVLIAEAAANFVNQTSSLFFEKYPNLELQFGLHATSVKDRLEFIRRVDPRIRIVWEDCGAFPFSYEPTDINEFDSTVSFLKEIATLRGKSDRFSIVTKGLVQLDWSHFEHLRGSQWIGVSSNAAKKRVIDRMAREWRYIQAGGIANADKAQQMIREIAKTKNGDFASFALVEDGMFEENIMYPVALYSEMLWDSDINIKDLMRTVALRGYVSFA